MRDVVAHLLDTDLRRISWQRDGWALPTETPVTGWDDLVKLLNGLNAGWVQAARRLSPRVLLELLTYSGRELAAVVATLDPDAPAPFSVLWAGQAESTNWFDLGREYTCLAFSQDAVRWTRPSIGGSKMRTHVPFAEAPVTPIACSGLIAVVVLQASSGAAPSMENPPIDDVGAGAAGSADGSP